MNATLELSRLAGRVAVVTGGAGGLGAAISEELVLSGLKVVAIDINLVNLQAMADRFKDTPRGGAFYPLKADITQKDDLKNAFKWIDENLGAIVAIVNNAGIAPMKPLEDSDNELMSAVLNTNVVGLAAASREAIDNMKKHKVVDGTIINIGSTVGHAESVSGTLLGMFPMPMYIASKHAVIGFNRALRAQLRTQGVNVRITDLSPGTIRTNLVSAETLERLEWGFMKPADVARAVRFVLATPPDVEIVHLQIQPAGEVW